MLGGSRLVLGLLGAIAGGCGRSGGLLNPSGAFIDGGAVVHVTAGRRARPGEGRRGRGQVEMLQDAADHHRVGEHRQDLHLAPAVLADRDVVLEDSLQEAGPVEVAIADHDEVFGEGLGRLIA